MLTKPWPQRKKIAFLKKKLVKSSRKVKLSSAGKKKWIF